MPTLFFRSAMSVFCLGVFLLVFLQATLRAEPEEYGLSNAPLPPAQQAEETFVILPDGRRVNPWLVLPEGWIVSDDGSLITDEGVIIHRNGHFEYPFGSLPEGYSERADGSLVLPSGIVLPKPQNRALVTSPVRPGKVEGSQDPQQKPRASSEKPPLRQDIVRPAQPRQATQRPAGVLPGREVPVREVPVGETPTQLWSMLPLTEVPGKPQAKPKGEKPRAQAAAEKPKEMPEGRAEAKPKQDKPKPQAKPENKPENKPQPRRESRRPKVGEELRIPQESVKTGNLDFLEGCWQGTRPEYYSKRTIYECFCFDKQGKNGKRRVIDPKGGRRCVGATQARLSGNGVLHVQSQGAVCSDGERWGQAEMTCRGQGQHTPCSWVFRDANGGQQSYAIPFVRVEQCGRR